MSSAIHAPDFDVQCCNGPILTLLECDSLALCGTGWRKYVRREDWAIAEQMQRDMAAGRGSHYRTTSIATSGDRFTLLTSSYLSGSNRLHTRSRLVAVELNRKHFPISRAIHLKKAKP